MYILSAIFIDELYIPVNSRNLLWISLITVYKFSLVLLPILGDNSLKLFLTKLNKAFSGSIVAASLTKLIVIISESERLLSVMFLEFLTSNRIILL